MIGWLHSAALAWQQAELASVAPAQECNPSPSHNQTQHMARFERTPTCKLRFKLLHATGRMLCLVLQYLRHAPSCLRF